MSKQTILTILLGTSVGVLGQNINYLRNYDIDSIEMKNIRVVDNDYVDYASRAEDIKLFDKERLQLLNLGTTWDRFLSMSMARGSKRSKSSFNSFDSISSKKTSFKRLSPTTILKV